MSKNFSQYDDDNPVMSVLAKARQEQKTKSAEEILQSAAERQDAESFPEEKSRISEKVSEKKETEEDENPAGIKKILMNISIRETTKKDWKMFFLEHDLTMTQGIETAVEFLKSEVGKGSIRLSKGGITK